MADSSAVKAHRSASGGRMGEARQAVGRSRFMGFIVTAMGLQFVLAGFKTFMQL